MSLKVTNDTVNFIKGFEALSLKPYADYRQYSIGYGTYAGPYPGPVPNIRLQSESQAHQLLMKDLEKRAADLSKGLKRPLNPFQQTAFLSFAFNAGIGAGQKVLNEINAGNMAGAVSLMLKYVHAGGKRLQGLVNRRMKEVELFQKPFSPGGKIPETTPPNVPLIIFILVVSTVLMYKFL